MVDKSRCGACNNMEAYWEEKARRQAAEKQRLQDEIDRLSHPGSERRAPTDPADNDEASLPGVAEDRVEQGRS